MNETKWENMFQSVSSLLFSNSSHWHFAFLCCAILQFFSSTLFPKCPPLLLILRAISKKTIAIKWLIWFDIMTKLLPKTDKCSMTRTATTFYCRCIGCTMRKIRKNIDSLSPAAYNFMLLSVVAADDNYCFVLSLLLCSPTIVNNRYLLLLTTS